MVLVECSQIMCVNIKMVRSSIRQRDILSLGFPGLFLSEEFPRQSYGQNDAD